MLHKPFIPLCIYVPTRNPEQDLLSSQNFHPTSWREMGTKPKHKKQIEHSTYRTNLIEQKRSTAQKLGVTWADLLKSGFALETPKSRSTERGLPQ